MSRQAHKVAEMVRDARECGELACPSCGAAMVHRAPKPGGKRFSPFYGCSNYPRCTGTVSERDAGSIVHGDFPDDPPPRDWGDL